MIFKLLVVDDEITVRKGIANYMNWSSIDCEVSGTASDGLEAIEFLKQHPVDIVITDIKMPAADGLAVAKYVFEQQPETKVILLTGYADFAYAQTAIRYNVSSFLLKPTNKKNLFEAVQEAQKMILTSRKNSISRKEDLAFLKDQLFLEMTDQTFRPAFLERLNEFQLSLEHYYIAAFCISPNAASRNDSSAAGQTAAQEDVAVLKHIVIEEKKNAYCYRYGSLIIAVYFQKQFCPSVPDTLLANCRNIISIAETLSRHVSAGISRCHSGAESFRFAVAESIQALSLNFYSADTISCLPPAPEAHPGASFSSEDCLYSLSAENSMDLFRFENCLNDWKFEEARSILASVFIKFKNNLTNSNDAKLICSQIYYLCCRVLMKKLLPAPESGYLAQIQSATDIFSLEHTLSALLSDTCTALSGWSSSQNRLIETAMQYVRDHLSDTLSLEEIAEHLHISPSHLSRTFKKNCRESLTEYINRIRIEKAREYLESSDILAYEIAERIGYHDSTYFSSIFKKYTGLSPTEYRKRTKKTNDRDAL